MKHKNMEHHHQKIVDHLRRLPRKMLLLHGVDNITEFVLHDLCSQNCFNIEKAAYFVDNPDFNCLKGVAGFARNEVNETGDIWQNPESFSKKMATSTFNQKVRSMVRESCRRCGQSESEIGKLIAHELGFTNYGVYSWGMKHDNYGLFVCEKGGSQEHAHDDIIIDGLCLLGFCHVH